MGPSYSAALPIRHPWLYLFTAAGPSTMWEMVLLRWLRGLKSLVRCFIEKSRRQRKKGKAFEHWGAFSLPTISWGFTGFPLPPNVLTWKKISFRNGKQTFFTPNIWKCSPLPPWNSGVGGVLSQSPEIIDLERHYENAHWQFTTTQRHCDLPLAEDRGKKRRRS